MFQERVLTVQVLYVLIYPLNQKPVRNLRLMTITVLDLHLRLTQSWLPWGSVGKKLPIIVENAGLIPESGERNGNWLQHSCLGNPRDGQAWWATVYGVTKSWTLLNHTPLPPHQHTHPYLPCFVSMAHHTVKGEKQVLNNYLPWSFFMCYFDRLISFGRLY